MSSSLTVCTIFISLISLALCSPLWLTFPEVDPVTANTGDATEDNFLLPRGYYPVSYDVDIITRLDLFQFPGTVQIVINITEANINYLTLHAHDLTIAQSDVTVTSTEFTYTVSSISFVNDKGQQFFRIDCLGYYQPGLVTVTIKYTGKLNDELQGFYRTKVTNNQGVESWMATTQFEQTYARRAFPCMDEPSQKAVFTLHIASPPNYIATSNMPVESQTAVPNLPGYVRTNFATTPRMSTYLIAFAVHQFYALIGGTDNKYSVYSQQDFVNYGSEALYVAPQAISFMEAYTQHTYDMPKQDNIAVPELSFGAMENWGLVTYRENLVLYNEDIARTADLEKVTTIVTHELAHQWFGNMVSPKWWNNTWLNEGFATYFEYHVTDKREPTWQMEQAFVHDEMHSVLMTDGLNTTHPLLTEVGDGPSATAAFDQIAYNKGGCIVRMMVSLMGEQNFKNGIRSYLTTKKFGNAEPSDLWNALTPYVPTNTLPAGKTFSDVMNPWNTQAGYPYITVTRDYTPGNGRATITQSRFLLEGKPWTFSEKWSIPLTYTTQAAPNFNDVSSKIWSVGTTPTNIPVVASSDQWTIFNIKQVGYYRVNYDSRNWFLLKFAMNSPSINDISEFNRAQVIDDALNLARGNILDYTTALDMTSYLGLETKYLPWATAYTVMSYIQDRISYTEEDRILVKDYLLARISHMYDVVNGVDISSSDSHALRRTRVTILNWACKLGHFDCVADEARLFRSWQSEQDPQNNNPIAPDLRASTYCTGMTTGGVFDYNFLLSRYGASTGALMATERSNIINGIGCAHDSGLLNTYLTESIASTSQIKPADARAVLTAVYSNHVGVDLTLDFLINKHARCAVVYGSVANVGRAFTSLAAKLNTQEHVNKLEAFRNAGSTPAELKPYILEAVNIVKLTIDWQTANRNEVVSFFAQAKQRPLGYVFDH